METTLRTNSGLYVCAELGGGGAVVANRKEAGAWETFTVEQVDASHIALKTADGQHYITAEDGGGSQGERVDDRPKGLLVANRTERGEWETFEVEKVDGGTALKSSAGFYVCAELGGGGQIVANRVAAGPWETFTAVMGGSGGIRVPVIHGWARRDGKLFADDAGAFRPLFFSALSILGANKPREAFLDWGLKKGFNGFRVFAGNLTFDGATASQARDALPTVLDMGKARGLRCEVTACTDTASMSKDEIRAHVRGVAEICAGRPEVFGLEIGNELWHPTQNPALTDTNFLAELRSIIRQSGYTGLVAYGAAQDDESTVFGGGDYVTVHLDRGRDMWNQVRRVREMQAVADATGKAVVNNEPIGAAEPGTPGQRLNDPAAFLCLGALSRLFEVGAIFHFEDGLHCTYPVGPTQDASANAFVRGFHSFPDDRRLTYKNATWPDSPVKSFDESRAVRAYCGVTGNDGMMVTVGGNDGGVEWQNGWRPSGIIEDLPGCRVTIIGK